MASQKQRFLIQMSEDDVADLDRACAQEGISRSAFVRRAVRRTLATDDYNKDIRQKTLRLVESWLQTIPLTVLKGYDASEVVDFVRSSLDIDPEFLPTRLDIDRMVRARGEQLRSAEVTATRQPVLAELAVRNRQLERGLLENQATRAKQAELQEARAKLEAKQAELQEARAKQAELQEARAKLQETWEKAARRPKAPHRKARPKS
jgi:Ribbon-helix-helix protein, copG family